MKKKQAVNLWKELHNSTDKETVFRKLDNKPGYGGKRTLIRYAQVDEGIKRGQALEEMVTLTGWRETFLTKVWTWWKEEFEVNPTRSFQRRETNAAEPSAVAIAEELGRREKHREIVLTPLANLTGIEPFPLGNPDLMNLYLRTETPSWPVPKGRIWREANGELTVHLRCQHDCEIACQDDIAWLCLNQHLEDHPLSKAIALTERTIPQDLSDRIQLLDAIQEKASRPAEEGGIGLNLIPDRRNGVDESSEGYGPYFLFTILHQGISRGVKLPLIPKRKEEFQFRPPGIIDLGGYPVVQSPDPGIRDRAVDWLLEMQDQVVTWPEAIRAVFSYTQARESCINIQRQLDLLQLQAGLPERIRCDNCPPTAGI